MNEIHTYNLKEKIHIQMCTSSMNIFLIKLENKYVREVGIVVVPSWERMEESF